MKKKTDPDMPVGKLTRIKDFLPPQGKLAMPKRGAKIRRAVLKRRNSAAEIRKLEAQYEAGYRKHPETPEELAIINAFTKSLAEPLPKEDW